MKLWLENKMAQELRSLFKQIGNDFYDKYSYTGTVVNLDAYELDMAGVLRKWYRRTADIFSKNIRADIKVSSNLLEYKDDNILANDTDKQDINLAVATSLLVFIESRSKEQANLIMNTTKDIIGESIRRIDKQSIDTGVPLTREGVASSVRRDFNASSVVRSQTIATFEVGMVASESKEIEATVLNESDATLLEDSGASISLQNKMVKNWNADLDSKTRMAHAEADFTYKYSPIPVGGLFSVGGEDLKYPRDPNGSARNVINCRCESLYFAKDI